MANLLQVVGGLVWIGIGILSFFAIRDGAAIWFGLSDIFGFILAFVLAGVPVLGSVVGVAAAAKLWDWTWMQALTWFLGPQVAVFLLALLVAIRARR